MNTPNDAYRTINANSTPELKIVSNMISVNLNVFNVVKSAAKSISSNAVFIEISITSNFVK
jgi:hypothetical protein